MRGVFGAAHPKNYPICALLTLPVKDFISDTAAAAEAENMIVANASRFNMQASDHVMIACNTAHLLLPQLERRTGLKFHSLIEVTAQEVHRRNLKRIGLLASPTTIKHKVHSFTSCKVIEPAEIEQVGRIIREVVNGTTTDFQKIFLRAEVKKMFSAGAEAIIVGCAELEMLLSMDNDERLIRPLELTVRKILEDGDV